MNTPLEVASSLILAASCCSGCGSIDAQQQYWSGAEKSRSRPNVYWRYSDSSVMLFSGLQVDWYLVNRGTSDTNWFYIDNIVGGVDFPFSLVLDIVLLPLTAGQTIEMACREDGNEAQVAPAHTP